MRWPRRTRRGPAAVAGPRRAPAGPAGALDLLPLQPRAGLQGVIGPVLQVGDRRLEVTGQVEDIAATGDLGQRRGLAGAEAGAEVGDDGLGGEAALGQFQQPHPPGVGVAVLLLTQQVAEGGGGIDAHQDRVAGLEDLVMGPDADGGQVVRAVDLAGPSDGGLDHVMDGAQRGLGVEEVAQQGDDAAVGAVAGQDQGEDQLTEPGLGDRQVEEDLLGRSRRVEGVVQGEPGGVGLLVEELAADLMLAGQSGDGLRAGEDLEGQLLPLRGGSCWAGQGIEPAAGSGSACVAGTRGVV